MLVAIGNEIRITWVDAEVMVLAGWTESSQHTTHQFSKVGSTEVRHPNPRMSDRFSTFSHAVENTHVGLFIRAACNAYGEQVVERERERETERRCRSNSP